MAAIDEVNRGKVMASIRSRDTRVELVLRRALRSVGLRGYRCNHPQLPGRPDVVFTRFKVAVFVDGAYWHGHPDFIRPTASPYWKTKIDQNRRRDRRVTQLLAHQGWRVIRLWDFEVQSRPQRAVALIQRMLRASPDCELSDHTRPPSLETQHSGTSSTPTQHMVVMPD